MRRGGSGFSPWIVDYHFEVRRQRELLLRLEEEMILVRKERERVGHLYFSLSLSYFLDFFDQNFFKKMLLINNIYKYCN